MSPRERRMGKEMWGTRRELRRMASMEVVLEGRAFLPKVSSLSSIELAEMPWKGHVSRSV